MSNQRLETFVWERQRGWSQIDAGRIDWRAILSQVGCKYCLSSLSIYHDRQQLVSDFKPFSNSKPYFTLHSG